MIHPAISGKMVYILLETNAQLPLSLIHIYKLGLGDINGIPRVLDAGQCNDSYSLAVIALKLKEVFGLHDINELPIVYTIAWYEDVYKRQS